MIRSFAILGLLILAGASPLSAQAQDNANIEINLDVIDRFAPPKKQTPNNPPPVPATEKPTVKKAEIKKYEPGTIPPPTPKLIRAYPDGTLKSDAIIEYERSLESLRAKYFPQEAVPLIPQQVPEVPTENLAQISSAAKAVSVTPQGQKPIPAPNYPPPRKATVSPFTQTALPDNRSPAKARIIDKSKEAGSDQKPAPAPNEIKGLKIVSIAYIDEEINLNPNVQNALVTTYIPRLQAQKKHRIGLYSYASTLNRSEKEANRLSLERAIALKNFLTASGVSAKRIDIFPAGRSKTASFSDWIDIIVEK